MNRRDRRAGRTHAPPSANPFSRQPPTPSAPHLFAVASQHHEAGRLADAEAAYRQVLEIDPKHADSLNSLGILAHQCGHSGDAIELISKAIAVNDRSAQYHYNIGVVYAALGRMDESVTHNRRAVALKPDYADAHTNLAGALTAQNQFGEAALHFRRALSRRSDSAIAYSNLATALQANGQPEQALDIIVRGLGVRQTDELKKAFALCLQELTEIPRLAGLRALAERALAECWGRPSELAAACTAVVKRDMQDFTGSRDLAALAGDRLLAQILISTPICDVALERLLTDARRAVLERAEAAASGDVAETILNFACALAQQCFINEYVLDRDPEERERAAVLQQRLAVALAAGEDVPALMVAAAAAYFPLHALGVTPEQWRQAWRQAWPHALQRLVVQQVHEPGEEQSLLLSIPVLTPIADDVSVRVRQQYEQNPYPRWNAISSLDNGLTFDQQMSVQFPMVTFARLGSSDVDILIASCGTGRHAIETARQRRGAKVLAIDLSLASLGYAMRKTRELGVANIAFAQADILQLGTLARTFDIIEAVGVLHHLRDPQEGWEALVALLRPGGFMRVGLYSALARSDVVAARAFIAARGYGDGADAIRQCRQDILRSGDAMLRKVSQSQDFFTTSGCRDLLFHVQEQRTDIAAIKAFLAACKLAFIGFDTPARSAYANLFPGDTAMTDLDHWQEFEIAHPATFAGMYQFWVQKPVL
jgi:Flp pilus assembly protein TadD/2-polyprenyl-3-methyl-5-hydroxy-6-metoxy-1,4-benzoquinol methylase